VHLWKTAGSSEQTSLCSTWTSSPLWFYSLNPKHNNQNHHFHDTNLNPTRRSLLIIILFSILATLTVIMIMMKSNQKSQSDTLNTLSAFILFSQRREATFSAGPSSGLRVGVGVAAVVRFSDAVDGCGDVTFRHEGWDVWLRWGGGEEQLCTLINTTRAEKPTQVKWVTVQVTFHPPQ